MSTCTKPTQNLRKTGAKPAQNGADPGQNGCRSGAKLGRFVAEHVRPVRYIGIKARTDVGGRVSDPERRATRFINSPASQPRILSDVPVSPFTFDRKGTLELRSRRGPPSSSQNRRESATVPRHSDTLRRAWPVQNRDGFRPSSATIELTAASAARCCWVSTAGSCSPPRTADLCVPPRPL